MNDLDMLRTMRAETPEPSQDALADARSRLLDRAAARSHWYRPRLRAGWPVAAVVVATLAVILGVRAIVTTAGGPSDRADSPQPDTVQSVLAQAAQTVAQKAPPAARATKGQYWYFKNVVRETMPGIGAGEDEVTAEYWYEVRSERPGKVGRVHFAYEAGHVTDVRRRNGEYVITENGRAVDHRTLPVKAFRDDPTDPAAWWLPDDVAAEAPTNPTDLLDFLRDHWSEGGDPFGPSVLGLLELVTQPILTPQQRAAAYEAASQLAADNAKIRIAPDVVDAAGRHGVGIVFDEGGFQRTTFILDKDSYEPLGYERVIVNSDGLSAQLQDAPELQPGSGTALAIVEHGVVDSVDERP